MTKSTIGKIVQTIVMIVGIGLMLANNLYRAFDSIPYGTFAVFAGFLGIWLLIAVTLGKRGYFDWWNK